MKAILEFNLEDSTDRLAHIRATKATDAYIALHKVANNIFRHHRKYAPQSVYVEDLEYQFHEILNDLNINIDLELE